MVKKEAHITPVERPDSPAANPRRVAADILLAVIQKSQPLDQSLEKTLKAAALAPRDQAFVRQMVYLVMRRLGALKHVLNQLVNKPISKEAALTRTVVLMGLAQILLMRTSDHAAVHESVELIAAAPHMKERGMKGLVNALLRRAVRERDHWLAAMDERPEADIAGPFRRRWNDHFGDHRVRALGMSLRSEPPLDITLKPGEDIQSWADQLDAEPLAGGTLRRSFTDVTGLAGFDGGHWWVQDRAAALPARLFGNVTGNHIVDMCAAPGGKTLQLASMGAQVTAADRSKIRAERLRQNLARTKLDAAVSVVVADAASFVPDTPADHILLDAPCSATGTFRRNPDVLWHKTANDINRLAGVQARLLDHAFSLLPVGGILVYCVCSLEREEGPDQIAAFLDRSNGAELQPITASEVPGFEDSLQADGTLVTMPSDPLNDGGMDGFYIARLSRSVPAL